MQCTSQTPRTYRVLSPNEQQEIMIGLRTNESIRSIAGRCESQRLGDLS